MLNDLWGGIQSGFWHVVYWLHDHILFFAIVLAILLLIDVVYSWVLAARKEEYLEQVALAEETYRQVENYQSDLRHQVEENTRLTEERDNYRHHYELAFPFHKQAHELAQVITTMKRVWREPGHSERECVELLSSNPWVLWPDYVLRDKLYVDQSVGTALKVLFEGDEPPAFAEYANFPTYTTLRMDGFGWASVRSSLQPTHYREDGEVLLIIEFKRADKRIGTREMQQAYTYATNMLAEAANHFWGGPKAIDCLVIGKDIDPKISDYYLRLGKSNSESVRIVPVSYETLIARAEKLVEQMTGLDI